MRFNQLHFLSFFFVSTSLAAQCVDCQSQAITGDPSEIKPEYAYVTSGWHRAASDVLEVGIIYGQSPNLLNSEVSKPTKRTRVQLKMDNLQRGATYFYRAIVRTEKDTVHGQLRRFTTPVLSWDQLGSRIDGQSQGDEAGDWVAISGDGRTLGIGAGHSDGAFNEGGEVRVYREINGQWQQIGGPIYGVDKFDYFGKFLALSTDGNRLAVGSAWNDDFDRNAGHVRVFQYQSGNWVQMGTTILGSDRHEMLGRSVWLNGDGSSLVVGAPRNDSTGINAGAAMVYDWNGSNWTRRGLAVGGESAGDLFGRVVSISDNGNTIAVGAPNNDDGGTSAGHVRVFDWNGSSWVQRGNDIDGVESFERSSKSFGLSGDGNTVAVGGYLNNDAGRNAGQCRMYRWNGSSWQLLGQPINGDAAGDLCSYTLAVNGDGNILALGSEKNNENGNSAGKLRVFQWNGQQWQQVAESLYGQEPLEDFTHGVAISDDGKRVAVASDKANYNGRLSGCVRVFELNEP